MGLPDRGKENVAEPLVIGHPRKESAARNVLANVGFLKIIWNDCN